MTAIEDLLPRITTLTFDCYGTIIDWSAGLAKAFERIFGDSFDQHRDALFDTYNKLEAQVESEGFRPYREVMKLTVERVAERFEITIEPSACELLGQSLPTWLPFADSNQALVRLKQRFKLGILSNIDRDLFAASADHLDVAFDFLVTAQDVQSYKPGVVHFDRAIELVGSRDEILHVAQSLYHDGVPAGKQGISFVWINRYSHSNQLGVKPVAEFPDLKSLADAVCQ